MAKNPTKGKNVNMELLAQIANGSVTHVSADEGLALVEKGYIEVNPNMMENGKAATRITPVGSAALSPQTESSKPMFEIMSGVPLPPSRRGNRGTGAPKKYPFDDMNVGDSVFVPVSEQYPDPMKSMQSTVASTNRRWSEETSEVKTVERAKRGPGNKAVLDPNGAKIYENTTIKVRKPLRKYVIRPIKSGEKLGEWTAPKDGVLIGRVEIA